MPGYWDRFNTWLGQSKLEDMRLFAKVAERKSFTTTAKLLQVPKQTLSRRVAELERALGVQLLRRTTRRLHLTSVGAAYFARCADMVRAADEANRATKRESGSISRYSPN
jgi:DNA-binding transcriptional LysR family regulator